MKQILYYSLNNCRSVARRQLEYNHEGNDTGSLQMTSDYILVDKSAHVREGNVGANDRYK